MVVIAHQHPGMHAPDGARTSLPKRFEKAPPVRIVIENRLAPVPTIKNVVNGSLKFNACFAGHKSFRSLPNPARPGKRNSRF